MFRSRYVCGPTGHEETGHSIPLLPELEQSFSALVGSCGELGMEGIRRAMLATDALEDGGCGGVVGVGGGGVLPSSPLRHDPSLHYESESLQLSDTADLCRLSQLRLQSTSDLILGHDRHLGDNPHNPHDVMYTELTSHYREFSPSGSTGDCGLEPELSDSSSSESGLESPSSADQWDPMADSGVSISMDPDGPLPPVSDIFAHRLHKEDYGDIMYPNRGLPFFIKTERLDSEEDESLDCCPPTLIKSYPPSSSSPSFPLSYTTLHPHFLAASAAPAAITTTTTSTTNNSNYHDYTTPREDFVNNNTPTAATTQRMGGGSWVAGKESSGSSGLLLQPSSSSPPPRGGGGLGGVVPGQEGEKGQQQRKKPGRKKGQVSKVLHLWEFIRDLLSDPTYCPRIISWENEREGVFRVLHSSEVARLWGEKKKNKKTMTYEKLSRSLRYSRKEGYFDALPRDRGYPKKLCFKFGPKSHGWSEYKH